MKRVQSLNGYQKVVLLLLSAMVLVFTVLYSITVARVGFSYKNAILIPGTENGVSVYSGKIRGQQAVFTVSPDKTVEFHYGDKTYGPYTVREDPTAIPKGDDMGELMTGVEVRLGEEILFRGGAINLEGFWWLHNEDGSPKNLTVSYVTAEGIERDGNGNVVDPMEPSVSTVLDLVTGPELTHKGEWAAWICGMFACVAAAVSILFADELFRWNLSFRIRDVDSAEPSDWEMMGRYIAWTALPILAMVFFVTGLQ